MVCPANDQTHFNNYKFSGTICHLNLETTNLPLLASWILNYNDSNKVSLSNTMYIINSVPRQEILLHFADKNMYSALITPYIRVRLSL